MQKKITPNPILRRYLIILTIGTFILAFQYPVWFFTIDQACLLLLLPSVLAIVFHPIRKQVLLSNKKTPPLAIFYSKILLIQLACYSLFITVINSLWRVDPAITQSMAQQTLQQSLDQYTLFPWSFYCLLIIAFSYLKQQQKPLTYTNLILPILKKPPQVIHVLCDVVARTSAMLAMTLTLFALLLLLINTFSSPWLNNLTMGVALPHLVIISCIISLLHSPVWTKFITRELRKKKRFGFLFSMLSAFLFVLFLGLHVVDHQVVLTSPEVLDTIVPWLQTGDEILFLRLILLCWWIGFARLLCAYLSDICAGRRIITIIFSTLALPIILCVINAVQPAWMTAFTTLCSSNTIVITSLLLISAVIFFTFFGRAQQASWFLLSGEVDSGHLRDYPRKQALRWFFSIVSILICLFLTGLRLPAIFYGLPTWLICLSFIGVLIILQRIDATYTQVHNEPTSLDTVNSSH